MPQPTPYNRGFSFTAFQAASPSAPLPAVHVDAELDGLANTLSGVLGNLALIQRDDGKLADGCVTVDSISAALLMAIAAEAPEGPQGIQGIQGLPGLNGLNAPNPNLAVTAHSLAPGAAATATLSGAYPNLTIDFGLPKGDAAAPGAATLMDADYGDLVVSAGGSHMKVETVLDGQVPSVVGHTHAIANVTGLQAALDAKQGLDATLTALAALAYPGHRAVAVLSGADTFDVVGVGNNIGYVLDRAAGDSLYPPIAHTHAIADIINGADLQPILDGLQTQINSANTAIAGKQAAGSYATTAQLAGKADALTTVGDFDSDVVVSNDNNGQYIRHLGSTSRTVSFGTVTAGVVLILVNRASANTTISCPGGYYKNGAAATSAANLTLVPGGKITAFHEGGGVWAFDGTGF
jgi:hypothetical protein